MELTNRQLSYLDLYKQYVNSTPAIYGLTFRSSKVSSAKPDAITTNQAQFSTKQVESQLITDSDSKLSDLADISAIDDLSQISFQQGHETKCQSTLRSSLEIRQSFFVAAGACGLSSVSTIARILFKPIHFVQQLISHISSQIRSITVYNAEWKNLRALVDVEALKPAVFYLSAESNQLQILSQFKSAFKLSRMTEFSVAYCCEVFGVDAKLVNSIVQQDLR
ncbi:Hypothetical_protein [Hexamita inflata]|uniref:Hypothetical_protein n=1 Tax=Hexamita inflata TaxID=28002 RepID=A0AA86R3D8_9EUKA|nr:Hypothetical protein HINF_LOCUS52913 [Hexamita inflata]